MTAGSLVSRRLRVSAITEREVIVEIPEHPGLESDLPMPAPARPPPRLEPAY